MLRLLGRILIILLVASVISGGVYWIAQTDTAGALMVSAGPGRQQATAAAQQGLASNEQGTVAFERNGDHEEGAGSGQAGAWAGILKNLGIVGLVTVVIATFGTVRRWFKRRWTLKSPHKGVLDKGAVAG